MHAILDDIRAKLHKKAYKNEEQIRLSLVARILQELGWNIWEPTEVYTEFSPEKGKMRVDIALFAGHSRTPIFIEIKAPEKLKNPTELAKAEEQLRDYNTEFTALFTILTDGSQWRFYYSLTTGSFSDKCFGIINLEKENNQRIIDFFNAFLSKKSIIDNSAHKTAEMELNSMRKNNLIEKHIQEARNLQQTNPFLNQIEAINEILQKNGIKDITKDDILNFFNLPRPANPSPKTEEKPQQTPVYTEKHISNSVETNVAFTKIISGKINEKHATNWQKLLRLCLHEAFLKTRNFDEIRTISQLNIRYDNAKEKGFHEIANTRYFVQNVDANKASNAIMKLATHFNLIVEIKFRWENKNPAEYGEIVLPIISKKGNYDKEKFLYSAENAQKSGAFSEISDSVKWQNQQRDEWEKRTDR